MRRFLTPFSVLSFGPSLLAWWLVLGGPAPARAQPPGALDTANRLVDQDGDEGLRKRFRDQNRQFSGFVKGEQVPGAQDAGILETGAKWFVYRLTWSELRRTGGIEDVFREFDQQVLQPALKAKEQNQDFMKMYTQQLQTQLQRILQNASVVNQINGARLMARWGRSGQTEYADFLVGVLQDKANNDAVKFYTLQGLMELRGANPRLQPQAREAKVDQALLDYLAAKSQAGDNLPGPEADGVRYVRREAVRALAQPQQPGQNPDLPGVPLALARVVGRDAGMVPSPSLSEQAEAAIGLGQMQNKRFANYQPDYAAYFVGLFLVDFVTRAGGDQRSATPSQAWKYQALRLSNAMDTWQGDPGVSPYVKGVAARGSTVLKNITAGQTVDPTSLQALRDQVGANPPQPTLIQGDAGSVVKPGAPAETPAGVPAGVPAEAPTGLPTGG
ncbi:MAG: hypothetical protein JO112_03070 [Planctomycetes bacterium]|nr:hypothetical protein [Planctomycetota bacterium]